MKQPVIVILHGWGLSGDTFLPLTNELKARGYTVFAPDFPGFGAATIPSHAWDLGDYAKFLHHYLQQHHIVNPIFIGHSFGGRVSLKYEHLYPKSVRALILSGAPGFSPVNRKKLFIFIALAKIGATFWSLPVLNFLKETVRTWYYSLVGAREFSKAKGVMRQIFKNIVQEELITPMKAVHVPCMLIWGENDTIVPVDIAKKMVSVIPGAKLSILPECDHRVPYKEPMVFADSVITFLRRL